MNPRHILIIGATSTIAEHCARLWTAQGPVQFTLIARDLPKAEAIAADLCARNTQVAARVLIVDFNDPGAIGSLIDRVVADAPIDIALIAHGSLPEQSQCEQNLQICNDSLLINAVSPVLFAEAIASHFDKVGRGTLAVIGSVAGDRGRKSNYVYGASKGLIDRYAQGLAHRFAQTAVRIVLIKPGPTDTTMTAHLKAGGQSLACVEAVAERIVKGVGAGNAIIYAPAKWWLIMLVIRHVPRFLFNRMNI